MRTSTDQKPQKTIGGFAATLLAAVTLALGCGDGRTFTAKEFVDEINAQGVEMSLGEPLFTEEEGKELYAIELEPVAEPPGEAEGGEGGQGHSSGSLSIYNDTGGADDEIESCHAAADLLCYQAANVVVVLEGGGIESQQLGVAIQRLSEE
jgi:hypothetical protein